MLIKRGLFDQIRHFSDSPEAIVITGMRRVGKTTLLNYLFESIASPNKLFLDLENPLNQKYFEEENYERIRFNLEALGLIFKHKAFVFLDEIRFVKNLPSVVKYLYDHYNVKFFLTGSASFYLKNLFSESLSGRKYIFELFPLNFFEFLVFKGKNLKLPPSGKVLNYSLYETFAPLYEEYLLFGAFPQVVLKDSATEKQKALGDIFASYFQKEVTQLGDFRNVNIIRDLILLLAQRVGQKLDISKLSVELGLSRPTIYEYLSFLEGTYFIKLLKPFSRGRDVEIRKQSKVYFCDCGLLNSLGNSNKGALFENAIFQNLRLKGELNYFQKKSGVELDFILDKKTAFEVKYKALARDKKEIERVSADLGLKNYYLVSHEYVEKPKVVYGFMV